ncbi:MAG: hypothetical protein AMJ69_08960 [Gammaproteobacteria bacterium SG8_47]|nr:MAG: hypothetical protein AMJ69_08960 [Gammaproteobacteria bacterium SG8_47]
MPTRLITRIGLLIVAAVIAALAYHGGLDEVGKRYTQQGLQRALVTFALARGLNAVISVAQSTEVAFEPAGVGVTFGPGEILDPVNDLVERFSWVMLVSGTSLGVQRALIEISSWRGFSLLLGVTLAAALVCVWLAPTRLRVLAPWLLKLALVLTVLRFTVPLIAIGNEAIYAAFLAPRYDLSRAELEQATERIGAINEEQTRAASEAEQTSLLDQAKQWYQSASRQFDVSGRIEQYEAAVAQTSEHVIDLIVVFVLQTVLFPLLFLWLAIKLVKRLLTALLFVDWGAAGPVVGRG